MPVSSIVHRLIMYFTFLTPIILSSATHNRRILHQPFFPQDSLPPTPPPKNPGSSSTPPEAPFFPFFPSPPPPSSPASSASFPANVSSVIFPPPSKSRRASSKLIATAVTAAVAAIVLFSIALYLHFRKRRNRGVADTKTQISNNSSRINYPVSGRGNIPILQRPSQTSSEFLYLGTLVNSHGGISNECTDHPQNSPLADSRALGSRKRDSPELRPLPPLSGQSVRKNQENIELVVSAHDDDEEFYSPKGSLGAIDSSIGTGSASRRAFSAAELETFVGLCSSSSYSSSSSASGSPIRSASRSISPPVSVSRKVSSLNTPELVAVEGAPLRLPPPSLPPPSLPPPPISLFRVSLVDQKESRSLSLSLSKSPSPPTSTSPERVDSKSRDTSPRVSDSAASNSNSPQLIYNPGQQNLPPPVPPPPPPLPPVNHWESPRIPTPQATRFIAEPPDFFTPLRPMSLDSPSLISPIQLPTGKEINGKNDKILDSNRNDDDNDDFSKPKLKPLHWDKVRASSDREMVWDQLKSSSFKLNEEMFETLFVAKAPNLTPKEATRWPVLPSPSQMNRILDAKKSQNIAILLKALNVTVDEVCDALLEGNADNIGTELLESLLKMAPSKEEERKLKEYKDDSPIKLGVAEKFLKAVLDIPFAFKRVEALLYVSNFEPEIEYLKNSFQTLEAACEELRKSRMFLKLLEAVLKTGNRMNIGTNRGDAQAFKLDTLLKLVDIKGADGKTTLLHFVVQEIIRSEGARIRNVNQNNTTISSMIDDNDDLKCRKLGLQVVSSLGSELNNVKKAAAMDSEVLHSESLKLSNGLKGISEIVKLVETETEFAMSMAKFIEKSETEMIRIQAEESVALTLVKEITEYFHGNSVKEEARPFRIFMIVRDFLTVLDRVCREVGSINERIMISNVHKFPIPTNPTFQQTSGGFTGKRHYSSSEDES